MRRRRFFLKRFFENLDKCKRILVKTLHTAPALIWHLGWDRPPADPRYLGLDGTRPPAGPWDWDRPPAGPRYLGLDGTGLRPVPGTWDRMGPGLRPVPCMVSGTFFSHVRSGTQYTFESFFNDNLRKV